MAREMQIEGMVKISKMLEQAGAQAGAIAKQGLYVGNGIVADAIADAIENIQTAPFRFVKKGYRLPSPEEVDVIRGHSGISKIRENGAEVVAYVGFQHEGYEMMNGKKVPVPLIVNAIHSGTSFMHKQPFVRKAVRQVKARASAEIAAKIEQCLKTITEDK